MRTPRPRAPRAAAPRREGFTLVELLVIVAIIGMLLGVGIPALQQMILRSKLEGIARETSTIMVSARFQAIKRAQTVLVQIDTATEEIISFVDSDLSGVFEPANDRMLNHSTLTAGLDFAAPGIEPVIEGFEVSGSVGTARFNPDGSASATGAFRFADARRNYIEVRLEPLASARIEIQKWDDELGEYLAQGEKGRTWKWGTGA